MPLSVSENVHSVPTASELISPFTYVPNGCLLCSNIGFETKKAEVHVHNGTNHVKIPEQEELIPLFEYTWLVTVFERNGIWYRLEDPTADCEGRAAHKDAKKAQIQGELERREAELQAREARLKEAELDLDRRKKEFEAELASMRREPEPATMPKEESENSPRDPIVGRPPGSPGLSTNVSIPKRVNSSHNSSSSSISTFITARRRVDSSLDGSSGYNSSSGASTPTAPSSPSRAFIGASRAAYKQNIFQPASEGSTPELVISPLASAPSPLYLPEPRLSSSLPSKSPLASMSAPQIPAVSPAAAGISFGSPTSPRRVSSLPPSEFASIIPNRPLSNPSSPRTMEDGTSSAREGSPFTSPLVTFEIPLESIWTKEQCDEWLLSKNYPSTNPNDKTSSGQKAIHCAALEGQVEIVEYLVSRGGIEITTKDLLGNTPLICAASKGRLDTAKWLIAHGATVEHKAPSGRSALHSAAAGGHVVMCELLVQCGADPLEKEQFGKTPRALAESYNHRAVSDFLKSAESNAAHRA